jgi:AcrR family transcriptional regulator
MAAAKPRTRRRRKEARPAEIIEAGLLEFAAHGFAGARLEDVARRAGVVKGTIYRYFADKEALFVAAVRSRIPPFLDTTDTLIEAFPGTTREILLHVFRVVYGHVVDSDLRILIKIIITEGSHFPHLRELYYQDTIAKGRRLLEKIVARGVARGEVRPDHAALLPLVIMAPAVMAVMWRMVFDPLDPIATQDFFEAHVDLVFHGLLAHSPAAPPASLAPAAAPTTPAAPVLAAPPPKPRRVRPRA